MVDATTLQGRYRLEERLAAGGMGTVYAATDERLNRTVAVKVLRDQLADDPRFVERFRREARAVAALSHPNIAGIFDYGEDGGKHFIVMEYIDGHDLARVLRDEAPMAPERAARIGAQICAALGHAHDMEIVHRDVKPANVIVDDADRVKVTDFGIARAVGDSTLTATGSVLGTAQYLSPEQASGTGAGPLSDIYSAGIVLYEMLTGSVPFTGDSAVAVAMRHVSDEVPPPSSINNDVTPDLDQVVARATAKEPGDRFSSAIEMADALREAGRVTEPTGMGAVAGAAAAAAGTAVLDPVTETSRLGDTAPAPMAEWTPQRIGRAIALTLAALVLLLGVILVLNLLREGTDPTRERRENRAGTGTQPEETTSEETPTEAPASYTIEESLIGMDRKDAREYLEQDLAEFEFAVLEERIESDFDKHLVADVSPSPGTTVESGATITLYVSHGPPPHDEDEEEEDDD
ncbi:MAG: Stk1 family PASTA domain-containing Ser/Thr kinase [Actinomycetota bacterium]